MARSTFDGPILAGTNRFPPFRNVGSAELTQNGAMVLTNTTQNTVGYGGSSGVFVTNGQSFSNTSATLYTPSATNPVLSVTTPTADTASLIYRGFVMYVPAGSHVENVTIDMGVVPTTAAGSVTNVQVLVSNNFTAQGGTPTYAATGTFTAVGRQALSTFTGTQLANQFASSTDIVLSGGQGNVSQLVFTIIIAGSSMTTLTAGTFYFTAFYSQSDSAGTPTVYPFGNFG